jgi:hypothetical protein
MKFKTPFNAPIKNPINAFISRRQHGYIRLSGIAVFCALWIPAVSMPICILASGKYEAPGVNTISGVELVDVVVVNRKVSDGNPRGTVMTSVPFSPLTVIVVLGFGGREQ